MTLVETGRTTMSNYLESLVARGPYGQYFTDDVTLEVVGTDQAARGREGVEGMIRYLHEQAFDAHPQLKGLLVDGDHTAIEADFAGRHIGEFAGVAATGRDVRVGYSVHYDLEDGRIKALRIYLPMAALVEQISR